MMQKYVVIQGFHFGEVCQDIHVGAQIEFDQDMGRIKIGDFEHDIRPAPIVGAISRGWLRLVEDTALRTEPTQSFEGVQEARPIDPSAVEEKPQKKEKFEGIVYSEEEIPVDPSKIREEPKEEKPKIGRENREETDAITFDALKTLESDTNAEIIAAWDVKEHWAKRKKKIKNLSDIDTLKKLATLDAKMKSHIEQHIKDISNLGEEIDHKLSSLNTLEEQKASRKASKKTPKKTPKKTSKKSGPKEDAKRPKKDILGQDFDKHLNEQVESGDLQTK